MEYTKGKRATGHICFGGRSGLVAGTMTRMPPGRCFLLGRLSQSTSRAKNSRLQSVLPKLAPITSWENERGQNICLPEATDLSKLLSPEGPRLSPQANPGWRAMATCYSDDGLGLSNTVIPLVRSSRPGTSRAAQNAGAKSSGTQRVNLSNSTLGRLLLETLALSPDVATLEMEWLSTVELDWKGALPPPLAIVESAVCAMDQVWLGNEGVLARCPHT